MFKHKYIIQVSTSIVTSLFLFSLIIYLHLWPLIWISFAPLFYIIKDSTLFKSLIISTSYGLILTFTCFSWLKKYELKTLLLAAGFISIFFLLLTIVEKALNKFKKIDIISFPLAWMAMLLLFSFIFLGNFWLNIAYFQPATAPFIWYIGSYGITFLIILSNSTLAQVLLKKEKKDICLFLLILIVPLSSNIYSRIVKPLGQPLRVAMLQGNVSYPWKFRVIDYKKIFKRYEELTLNATNAGAKLVIWPEYSIPVDILQSPKVMSELSALATKNNIYLVMGTITNPMNSALITDTALVFGPDGKIVSRYDSVFPVPLDRNVIPGKVLTTTITPNFSFATGLCYEETEPTVFRAKTDFLVSMVNNQDFDHTHGTEFISLFSRLRAAENRRYLIRASNTGITQIIDPFGNVLSKIEPYKEGILVDTIYLSTPRN